MRVLCISGIWCGDCVQQGPLLERIAQANKCIDLRWIDRDQHADFTKHFREVDDRRAKDSQVGF